MCITKIKMINCLSLLKNIIFENLIDYWGSKPPITQNISNSYFLYLLCQTWVGFGFSNPKSKIQIQNPGFWSGFKILFSGWILDLDLNPFFGQGFPNPFLNPFCRGNYYFTIFPPSFSILSISVCFSRVSNMKQTCILHLIWSWAKIKIPIHTKKQTIF